MLKNGIFLILFPCYCFSGVNSYGTIEQTVENNGRKWIETNSADTQLVDVWTIFKLTTSIMPSGVTARVGLINNGQGWEGSVSSGSSLDKELNIWVGTGSNNRRFSVWMSLTNTGPIDRYLCVTGRALQGQNGYYSRTVSACGTVPANHKCSFKLVYPNNISLTQGDKFDSSLTYTYMGYGGDSGERNLKISSPDIGSNGWLNMGKKNVFMKLEDTSSVFGNVWSLWAGGAPVSEGKHVVYKVTIDGTEATAGSGTSNVTATLDCP